MTSTFSSAINASLDASGAVATLAANIRPRFRANWIKKSIRGNSQDNTSFESKSSQHISHDGDAGDKLAQSSLMKKNCEKQNFRRNDDHKTTKQASLFTLKRQDESISGVHPKSSLRVNKRQASNPDEGINCFSTCVTPKVSTEDVRIKQPYFSVENTCEEDEAETSEKRVSDSSESERSRRPYYFQKSQQFRNSWRTHSVENPGLTGHSVNSGRSLTMVESECESDDDDDGMYAPPRVRVFVGRGATNPIKTILVNHQNNYQAHTKRQKTFSNRNQWRSIQLSPTHGTGTDETASLRNDNLGGCITPHIPGSSLSTTISREKSLNNKRCGHRFDCTCATRLIRTGKRKSSLTPLLNATDYTTCPKRPMIDVSRGGLKVPLSKQASSLHSSDDKVVDPVVALRQRR